MDRRKTRDPTKANGMHCHRCGSKEVRYLRRTHTIYCRVCGTEWNADWVDAPDKKTKPKGRKGG